MMFPAKPQEIMSSRGVEELTFREYKIMPALSGRLNATPPHKVAGRMNELWQEST